MKQQVIILMLGEVAQDVRGEIFTPNLVKSAPIYTSASIPRQVVVGSEEVPIDGQTVTFQLRGYPPDILLVQTAIEVDDIFQKEVFEIEQRIYEQGYRLLEARGGNRQYTEEYSVFVISGYAGEPEQFLDRAPIIASLLKSERMELDSREVDYTLQSQIKYAKGDLAILDWDGAFLFDPDGDVREELELLTLANLQLLRHRILDRQLDRRLAHIGELAVLPPRGRLTLRHRELAQDLVEIIRSRMSSISELQRLERDIKLIGDWYSARLYERATAKFKIDEWARSIRGKLDSLEDIYSVVAENFAVSAKARAEWIQIIAFFILQLGWFLLIVLEIFHFAR